MEAVLGIFGKYVAPYLSNPLVLIALFALIALFIIKAILPYVDKSKIEPWVIEIITMGFVLIFIVITIFGFILLISKGCTSDNTENKTIKKTYFVVYVYASANQKVVLSIQQKLKWRGFTDADFKFLHDKKLYNPSCVVQKR